ncbi:tail fiber protein [Olleya sp. Bg11-27]|uniref:tail fiber protein n=1 Tax=Olleya sp. Bg11-27 TaxID=2058135 RepID=UPI0012FD1822|nr:tail fiber protein [Olleya sp. Bg11-27]
MKLLIALIAISCGLNAQNIDLNNSTDYIRIQKYGESDFSRAFGINSSNNMYIGSVEKTIGDIYFFNKGVNYLMTIKLNGNVGIGTTQPTSKLFIKQPLDNNNGGLSISDTVGRLIQIYGEGSAGRQVIGTSGTVNPLAFDLNGNEKMRISENGNVGIGTSNPTSKLQIQDNTATGWFQNIKGKAINVDQIIGIKLSGGYSSEFKKWGGIATVVESVYANDTGLALYANELERLRISSNGNIGIGTTNPDSKLTVAGNIHSREVKVTVNAGADFVFENNYELPTLEEIETYVKKNKHLPEIAPAKEMKKNGVNIGDFQIKLLQKIEELTLYTISQEKSIREQKTQIKKQQKEIENLKLIEERLYKIEKLLESKK